MNYLSTRGGDKAGSFKEVVLKGLADDGGLFVPETYPRFSSQEIKSFKNMSYSELAYEIISEFAFDSINPQDLKNILAEVYNENVFADKDIAPLKRLNDNEYILELFHGPTLAFKDFALQLLGRFFDHFLAKEDRKINILGATSGDTGSAAIAGCVGRKNVNIFILHPHGKVSEVQRRQMTTIIADNVFNIAVDGSFDDCQNIVKEVMGDIEFKAKYGISAVNSINWARIVAQIVYYFYAALKLGAPEKKVSFTVPTGNFGDILAGWIAWKMGLPIEKLVIATNKNDILHRFMQTGEYKKEQVFHTISPSMDIQISSNFERLLFEYHHRDSYKIVNKINQLKEQGSFKVSAEVLDDIKSIFVSGRVDDSETLEVIKSCQSEYGELLDPHTAIGYGVSKKFTQSGIPMVTLATAHPAKFPDAVMKASNIRPMLPEFLNDLFERKESYEISDASVSSIKRMIELKN